MSNAAQPKCRFRFRTFLRWFVFVVAIATIAGSLARFCFSLNTQLSGQSMGQVATVTFGVLFMPCGMSLIGSVLSKHSIREQSAVLAVLLAIVSCALAFAYDCIGRGKPLATFYGGGGSGVVSAYEVFLVWALCLIASIIQMTLVHYDSLHREATLIVGGCLAVVGILLPKMLESYEMLQAYCFDSSCGADNQLGIVQYEVAIAASASLATLFAVGVLAPTWKLWIFGLYDDDGRKSLGGVELQVAKESWLQDSSVSDATLRKTPQRNTIPHPLLEAAVSGVVAGVCLSIVSRLFGRR